MYNAVSETDTVSKSDTVAQVGKEVVLEDAADFHKQTGIKSLLVKDLVCIFPGTRKHSGEFGYGNTRIVQYLLDPIADMHTKSRASGREA